MAIFQSDITIKRAIDLTVEEMRKNPWLIQDMLSDCVSNSYLLDKYGQKQVDAAKEWLANNQIDVYMRNRNDKDKLPCITISLGTSKELDENRTMADQSTDTVVLQPNDIGKPIPYIVKPFTPAGYDPVTGTITIDPTIKGMDIVNQGMILVNPANGQGYVIQGATGTGILITPGIDLEATKLAVVPQYAFYKARVEQSFFAESYQIACHAHGDPQTLLWLHSIVLYGLLRYRESLFEANGFMQSSLSSSDLLTDPNYSGPGGEQAFIRIITISGIVQNTWIKSPRRTVEAIALKEQVPVTIDNPDGFIGGIKILSNLDAPAFLNKKNEAWYTDQDPETSDINDPEDQGE